MILYIGRLRERPSRSQSQFATSAMGVSGLQSLFPFLLLSKGTVGSIHFPDLPELVLGKKSDLNGTKFICASCPQEIFSL